MDRNTQTTAYIIQTATMPFDVPARLERSGLAVISAATIEGLYVEPAGSLRPVLDELEELGVEVTSLRRVNPRHGWESRVNPVLLRRSSLRSARSATWLPTYPAA